MLDEQHIQARLPLWEALSDLWLDTQHSDDWKKLVAVVRRRRNERAV